MNSPQSTAAGPDHNSVPVSDHAGRLAAFVYSGLFILLGIGAILWLVIAVITDPAIRTAITPPPGDEPPSLVMAFLTQFGIVVPLLVLSLGTLSIWLGIRLRTRDIVAARWAQVALAWLAVGVFIVATADAIRLIFGFWNNQDVPPDQMQIVALLGSLLGASLFAMAWAWLNRNGEHVFPRSGTTWLARNQIGLDTTHPHPCRVRDRCRTPAGTDLHSKPD